MKQKERDWLTTGQAAQLCAVTPATVLNWIRKGRLEGVRTAGGHYRIRRAELLPLFADYEVTGWDRFRQTDTTGRSLRCWEYLSDGGILRPECHECVVYEVRAAWCFKVAQLEPLASRATAMCPTSCEQCAYYRRVMGLPTQVLVVSPDANLERALQGDSLDTIELRCARTPYEASAVVGSFSPAFVVVDQEAIDSTGDLLDSLSADPRLPGLKLVLVGPDGAGAEGESLSQRRSVVSTIAKPFGVHDIAMVIESFPVEVIGAGDVGNPDLSPEEGGSMIQAQYAAAGARPKDTGAVKVDDDGFLKTMSSWTRSSAEALALEHRIGPLTEDHWKVIEYVQRFYRAYGKGPPVVKVHQETGLTSADICRLFPCGMVKGAYRLAGLPRPPGCG